MSEPTISKVPQLSRIDFLKSDVKVIASTCSLLGAGVKQLTTTINMMRNTSNQHSNTSQLVCQNHEVASQNAPSIVALPVSVITFVTRRSIPIRKPTIIVYSPALGVIFLKKIPIANTATMAGAKSD